MTGLPSPLFRYRSMMVAGSALHTRSIARAFSIGAAATGASGFGVPAPPPPGAARAAPACAQVAWSQALLIAVPWVRRCGERFCGGCPWACSLYQDVARSRDGFSAGLLGALRLVVRSQASPSPRKCSLYM